MQLFYVPDITLPHYTLSEDESGHCLRVLRLGHGDEIHLTDGRGNLHRAVIEEPHPKHCSVRVIETTPAYGRRNYSLTLAVAPTKNTERWEWFLEKATETGIDHIIPLECRHSERRTLKNDRSARIITSAVKQSLKAYHPQLNEMTAFATVVSMPFEGRKLIAHCHPGVERIFIGEAFDKGDDVLILIGPEGDFSDEEILLARTNGFTEISLGQSRLRTETAALSAVTIVSFKNGCS